MTTNKGPRKYTKKPVTIEAMQLAGTPAETMEVCEWLVFNGYPWLLGNALEPDTLVTPTGEPGVKGIYQDPGTGELVIRTLEGDMRATYGDFIIKGIQGEFYPCKPDIFEATYSPTPQTLGEALNS